MRAVIWPGALAAAAVVVVLGTGPVAGAPAVAATARLATTAGPATASAGAVSWGDNSAGELGTGTAAASRAPAAVADLARPVAVAAGDRFTVALLSGGSVVAWGDGRDGQLGNGGRASSDVPVPVSGLSGVKAVAAGGAHALALLANGTVMAWGSNLDGQLGDGSVRSSDVPVPVRGLSGLIAIAAGGLHSLAVLSDGMVRAWGYGLDGQLGDGSFADSSVPVAVKGLTTVRAVAAGGLFSLALLSDGTVRAWGSGDDGQLGDGSSSASATPVPVTGLTGVTSVSAGANHVLALRRDGTVMGWGSNDHGQLALGAGVAGSDVPVRERGLSHVAAVSAGGLYSLALSSAGTVSAWGDGVFGQLGSSPVTDSLTPIAVPGLSGVLAISAGTHHAVALVPVPGPTGVKGTPLSVFTVVPTTDPGGGPLPTVADFSFSAVSAASAGDAVAVGNSFRTSQRPIAAHWDGTAWRPTPVPVPKAAQTFLQGVAEVGPGNAWAVGSSENSANSHQRTLIEHWDGSTWTIVPSPNPLGGTGGEDELQAVAGTGPTDVWAGGDEFSLNGGGINPLLEHFNGTSWKAVPGPAGLEFVRALAAVAPNDVWALGTTLATNTAAHWNGTRWTIAPVPSLQDGSNPTNLITGASAVSGTNVWASAFEGDARNQNLRIPYVLHWNGTAWSLHKIPNRGLEGSRLNGITALSATDVWAVGETDAGDGSLLTLAEHFNGTAWAPVPAPDPGDQGELINSLFTATTSVPASHLLWAVGTQNQLGWCCDQTLAAKTTKA